MNYNYGYEYAGAPKSLETKPKAMKAKPWNNQRGRDDIKTMFFSKKKYRK